MKKKLLISLGLFVIITVVISAVWFVYDNQSIRESNKNVHIWLWDESDLEYDVAEKIVFVNNELLVFTKSNLSEIEKSTIAETVKGTIVGEIYGAVPVLQIQVDISDLSALKKKASTLMGLKTVYSATYDICLSNIDLNEITEPWSENPDEPDKNLGTEDLPGGNDWWAEAVSAYSAWNYIDNHKERVNQVKLGILDLAQEKKTY